MKYTQENLDLIKKWSSVVDFSGLTTMPQKLMMARVLDNQVRMINEIGQKEGKEAFDIAYEKYTEWLAEMRKNGFFGKIKE